MLNIIDSVQLGVDPATENDFAYFSWTTQASLMKIDMYIHLDDH